MNPRVLFTSALLCLALGAAALAQAATDNNDYKTSIEIPKGTNLDGFKVQINMNMPPATISWNDTRRSFVLLKADGTIYGYLLWNMMGLIVRDQNGKLLGHIRQNMPGQYVLDPATELELQPIKVR